MKFLLSILILILTFETWTKADDISEFQIEGISVEDSLLNFYDIENITSANKGYWPNSKKYYSITLNSKIEKYDNIKATVLQNDKNFIIKSIQGRLIIDKTSDCLKKKNEIKNEIYKLIPLTNEENYEFNYPQYLKSKAIITDLEMKDGEIRIWCDVVSAEMRNEGYKPGLAISVNTKIFSNWIKNEAYK